MNEKIQAFEAGVKAKLNGRRGCAVELPGGKGTAYVRSSTPEEYMQLQAYDPDIRDVWAPAFAKYVRDCFIDACDAEGNPLTFDDVQRIAGPGFVVNGGLGIAVNRISGSRTAQTRDL